MTRSKKLTSLEVVVEISLHSCEFVFVSVAIVFRSDVAALANSAMAARDVGVGLDRKSVQHQHL